MRTLSEVNISLIIVFAASAMLGAVFHEMGKDLWAYTKRLLARPTKENIRHLESSDEAPKA